MNGESNIADRIVPLGLDEGDINWYQKSRNMKGDIKVTQSMVFFHFLVLKLD